MKNLTREKEGAQAQSKRVEVREGKRRKEERSDRETKMSKKHAGDSTKEIEKQLFAFLLKRTRE